MKRVYHIPPEMVPRIWERALRLLTKTVEFQEEPMDFNQLYFECLEKYAQLWVAYDDDRNDMIWAGVTKLQVTPDAKVCKILVVGGREFINDVDLTNEVEQWARNEGCSQIIGIGRVGWARALKTRGFVVERRQVPIKVVKFLE